MHSEKFIFPFNLESNRKLYLDFVCTILENGKDTCTSEIAIWDIYVIEEKLQAVAV